MPPRPSGAIRSPAARSARAARGPSASRSSTPGSRAGAAELAADLEAAERHVPGIASRTGVGRHRRRRVEPLEPQLAVLGHRPQSVADVEQRGAAVAQRRDLLRAARRPRREPAGRLVGQALDDQPPQRRRRAHAAAPARSRRAPPSTSSTSASSTSASSRRICATASTLSSAAGMNLLERRNAARRGSGCARTRPRRWSRPRASSGPARGSTPAVSSRVNPSNGRTSEPSRGAHPEQRPPARR